MAEHRSSAPARLASIECMHHCNVCPGLDLLGPGSCLGRHGYRPRCRGGRWQVGRDSYYRRPAPGEVSHFWKDFIPIAGMQETAGWQLAPVAGLVAIM